jgi:hypothetical protein
MWKAACEACCVTWNFEHQIRFCSWAKKNHGNLDKNGQSQDLPNSKWLLASSSPALNTRNLTSDRIWLLLYLDKSLHVFLQAFHLCIYMSTKHNICEVNTCLYAHTVNAYNHIFIYSLWLFEYWWIWIFIGVITGLYEVCYPSSNRGFYVTVRSSFPLFPFHHIVQRRSLVDVVLGGLDVLGGCQNSGYLQRDLLFFQDFFPDWGLEWCIHWDSDKN